MAHTFFDLLEQVRQPELPWCSFVSVSQGRGGGSTSSSFEPYDLILLLNGDVQPSPWQPNSLIRAPSSKPPTKTTTPRNTIVKKTLIVVSDKANLEEIRQWVIGMWCLFDDRFTKLSWGLSNQVWFLSLRVVWKEISILCKRDRIGNTPNCWHDKAVKVKGWYQFAYPPWWSARL